MLAEIAGISCSL